MALIKNIGSMEGQDIIFYNTDDKKVRIASDGKEYNVKFYSLDMILVARYEEFDKRRKIEDAKNADIEDMKELYKLLEKK